MRSISIVLLTALLGACGGSSSDGITNPPLAKAKALDPFLTVRIRDVMDTSTTQGKADWRIYYNLIDSISPAPGFLSSYANITAREARFAQACFSSAADSLGQRSISFLALSDTTPAHTSQTDTTAMRVAVQWFAGNHVLPEGWMAMSFPQTDLWNSAQFANGHGLVPNDPVKWSWDLTGTGTPVLSERVAADTAGCNKFGG